MLKKGKKVVFLIYVFLQNVLISNILHKVGCVLQLDDLSLEGGIEKAMN